MRSLEWKMFVQQQLTLLPAIAPLSYLLNLLFYRLDGARLIAVSSRWVPLFVLSGTIVPYVIIRFLTRRALRRSEDDAPGQRLRRILVLPRQLEVAIVLSYVAGSFPFAVAMYVSLGRPLVMLGVALLLNLVMISLGAVRQTLRIEELLRPLAVEEFERHPGARPAGAGFLWPRQVWHLPYVISLIVAVACTAFGVVLVSHYGTFLDGALETLRQRGQGGLAAELSASLEQLVGEVWPTLLLTIGYVVVLGAVTALAVARRLRSGSRAVENAVQALASGAPALPRWPATDEMGDLAFATAGALGGLQERARALSASAQTVHEVARDLSALSSRQLQVVMTQSSSIDQSRQTAEEIGQAAQVASERSRTMLSTAELAEHVAKASQGTVRASLDQLGALQAHVSEMAEQMARLKERSLRIGSITRLVKGLADQSRMVALNAAIEATLAGAPGAAFSQVAQQIRRLADASTDAIEQVRDVLHDVDVAIDRAVLLSRTGMGKATSSIALATEHEKSLSSLSQVVEDNASSARQISTAVSQQASALSQIFGALDSLGKTTSQTVDAMAASELMGARAERAAREVDETMAGYRWREDPPAR